MFPIALEVMCIIISACHSDLLWDGFIYIVDKIGNVVILSDQRPIVDKALSCEGQFLFKDFDFMAWVRIFYFLVFRVRPIVRRGLYEGRDGSLFESQLKQNEAHGLRDHSPAQVPDTRLTKTKAPSHENQRHQ